MRDEKKGRDDKKERGDRRHMRVDTDFHVSCGRHINT